MAANHTEPNSRTNASILPAVAFEKVPLSFDIVQLMAGGGRSCSANFFSKVRWPRRTNA